jgi:hypothetical protein
MPSKSPTFFLCGWHVKYAFVGGSAINSAVCQQTAS